MNKITKPSIVSELLILMLDCTANNTENQQNKKGE